jgi:hypothetical protein
MQIDPLFYIKLVRVKDSSVLMNRRKYQGIVGELTYTDCCGLPAAESGFIKLVTGVISG